MNKQTLREETLQALREDINSAIAEMDDDFEDFDDDIFI